MVENDDLYKCLYAKTKVIKLPFDPVIPLPGISPKELKAEGRLGGSVG